MTMVYARPELDEAKNTQISNQQMKRANEYSKIITGMKLQQPLSADLHAAILQIETNPSLFLEKMYLEPSFFNIRVANFVSRLSNEESEPFQSIDDYQLSLALAIRDNLDFRAIFTNPYFISFASSDNNNSDSPQAVSSFDISDDFRTSELHDKLNNYTLSFDQQAMIGQTVSNGYMHDGLMSSQGFGLRFISNGTNRRPIRAVYDMYLCSKIESYMDGSLNDMFVGPDISRNPGDNPHDYFQNAVAAIQCLMGNAELLPTMIKGITIASKSTMKLSMKNIIVTNRTIQKVMAI